MLCSVSVRLWCRIGLMWVRINVLAFVGNLLMIVVELECVRFG